jgi:putative transposase
MHCCRSSTCAGSQWAISRRRSAPLGRDAPNLSPSVIARLRDEWQADYARWQRRDLSTKNYVYVWADGVYLQARMEPQAECMLVLIGATPEGKKELLGFPVGMRESAQSWRELLVDLKARGLTIAPELAIGDGALGFWKALEEVSPTTRHQRCTVHKTATVLDKLPKSVQPSAKADLREIWHAPDRRNRNRDLCREVWCQIREGGRLLGEGP